MAALWKVPVIFIIENNHFGMGTAEKRASKSAQFYTRGDYIPGLWIDGMDVLAVKNGVAFAREFVLQHGPIVLEMVRQLMCMLASRHACLHACPKGLAMQSCGLFPVSRPAWQPAGHQTSGNGWQPQSDLVAGHEHAPLVPLQGPEVCCRTDQDRGRFDQVHRSGTSWLTASGVVQDTYRFSGHSISDPGTTYRTRDTVQGMRRSRDPIEHVRHLLTEHGLVDGKELKQVSLREQRCCCC